MTVAAFAEPFTGTTHAEFSQWARNVREYRVERAYDRPMVWLYDGDWGYRGRVHGEISGSVNPIVNEVGTIKLRLPIDLDEPRRTWAAFWALDEEARGTSNIHVRIETMGGRFCGRMKPKNGVTLIRGERGDEVVLEFFDDMAELQHVHTAGNPFLPISLIQQPKAWMLLAPADHGILLTLATNLLRLQLSNVSLPQDLLDLESWPSNPLDLWQQSQIIVKPRSIGDSVAPLALVIGSIRTSIFDVAAPIMEDAELQWDLRRWFPGDPEPWQGAGTNWIRPGTLFVDIVDKSGFRAGTSIGGNIATGLTRTIASVLSNHVEDSYDLFTGDTIDSTGYRLPGFLGTLPEHPYVVYRDGSITGILTSQFSRSPGGAGRITVGGQSMPGVALPHRETGGAKAIALGQRANFSGHQLRRGRTRRQPVGGHQLRRRVPGFRRLTRWSTRRISEPHLPGLDPRLHERPSIGAGFSAGLGPLPGDQQHQRHPGVHRRVGDGSAGPSPRNRPRHQLHPAGGQRESVADRRPRVRALVAR